MNRITVIAAKPLNKCEASGCGECRNVCQSACKTSNTVANHPCEQKRVRYGTRVSGVK